MGQLYLPPDVQHEGFVRPEPPRQADEQTAELFAVRIGRAEELHTIGAFLLNHHSVTEYLDDRSEGHINSNHQARPVVTWVTERRPDQHCQESTRFDSTIRAPLRKLSALVTDQTVARVAPPTRYVGKNIIPKLRVLGIRLAC